MSEFKIVKRFFVLLYNIFPSTLLRLEVFHFGGKFFVVMVIIVFSCCRFVGDVMLKVIVVLMHLCPLFRAFRLYRSFQNIVFFAKSLSFKNNCHFPKCCRFFKLSSFFNFYDLCFHFLRFRKIFSFICCYLFCLMILVV